ncbi:MAG TPA: phosphatase PAP2 family protein [Thermoanaerobaculia bacterium]
MDEDVSDWAREQTPLFGSAHRAETASNELKGASHVLMLATAIPPRDAADRWTVFALSAIEEEAIVAAVGAVTLGAKNAADRERPDASNRASFPSGHSSGSAATGALARETLARSAIPSRWHPAVRVGSRVIHGATAWARIEAGKHYPTDVLAGSALGNLLAVTLDRAIRDGKEVTVSIAPSREGVFLDARIRF